MKKITLFLLLIIAACSTSGDVNNTPNVNDGKTPTSFSFAQIASSDTDVNLSINRIFTTLKKDTILQDADRRAPTVWYTLSNFPLSTSALYDTMYPALRNSFGKSGAGGDRQFLPRFKTSPKGEDYIVLRMTTHDTTYQLKQKLDSDTMWLQGQDNSGTMLPISILVSAKGENFDTLTNRITDYYSAYGTKTTYEGSVIMSTTDGRTINVYIVSHDPTFTASVDFFANPMKYILPLNEGYKKLYPSSTQDFTDIYPLELALGSVTGKIWAVTSSEVKELGRTFKQAGANRFTGSFGIDTNEDWANMTIQGQFIQPIYLRRMFNSYLGQVLTRYNATFNSTSTGTLLVEGDKSSPYYDKLFTYITGRNELPGINPSPLYVIHYGFFEHPTTKQIHILSVDPDNGTYGTVREYEMKLTKSTTALNTWYRHVQTNTSGFESVIEVHPH